MPDELVEWSPTTRAQRNARERFDRWRVLRRDRHNRALLAPLDKRAAPILAARFWIEPEQLIARGSVAPT